MQLSLLVHQLWVDKVGTDVTFAVQCGDGSIEFTAHKLVLSLWSPVFADMFHHNKQPTNLIYINDVTPRIFEAMLKFMYGAKYDFSSDVKEINFNLKLYKAALSYQIQGLKESTRSVFASTTPNKNNVFQLLDAGKLLGSHSVVQRCLKVLQDKTMEVLATQELCNMSQDKMQTILDLPQVSFSSQLEFVTWVLAWIKNQCLNSSNTTSRHEFLANILPQLNIHHLKADEFSSLMQNHGYLMTEAEGFKIFMNITKPGSWPLPDWCPRKSKDRSFNKK